MCNAFYSLQPKIKPLNDKKTKPILDLATTAGLLLQHKQNFMKFLESALLWFSTNLRVFITTGSRLCSYAQGSKKAFYIEELEWHTCDLCHLYIIIRYFFLATAESWKCVVLHCPQHPHVPCPWLYQDASYTGYAKKLIPTTKSCPCK